MGKIKKVTLWGIICLCLYFSACSKSQESMENSNDLGKNEINSDEQNGSEEITGISKVIDDGTEDGANLEDALILKDGLKDETLVSGTITDEDELEKLASLDINIKGETNQVLLCKDPINNIVYYVNYGVDYFIYRIKDGKSELVVELPAKRLFFQEGKLYFMLESYKLYTLKDMENGNIFSYDPVSGEVIRIVDDRATLMFVYDDGIYYNVDSRVKLEGTQYTVDRKIYFYNFATAKREEGTGINSSIYKWNEYYLTYEVEPLEDDETSFNLVGLKLETLDKAKSLKLTEEELPEYFSFVGNKFYYILNSNNIGIYDIDTNERREIPIVDVFSRTADFTLLDGIIYLNNMLSIELDTGKQSVIGPKVEGEAIFEMYTDGENLYGLCGDFMGNHIVMKQIIIEEQKDQSTIRNPGTSNEYEMLGYVFYTVPIE